MTEMISGPGDVAAALATPRPGAGRTGQDCGVSGRRRGWRPVAVRRAVGAVDPDGPAVANRATAISSGCLPKDAERVSVRVRVRAKVMSGCGGSIARGIFAYCGVAA